VVWGAPPRSPLREGADVAINVLHQEESDAKEVIDLIRGAGCKGAALPGDIREEAFCQKLVGDAARELGGLDIVVNNAARQVAQESILDISTAQFDATFKTNVYAMFWITKAAMPLLKPGSSLIYTTSINAYSPEPHILDYAATKGTIGDTPMGRAGQPAELAPLYVMLAENKATYTTGQIFGATGGLGGA
jgi:NAD(P)-dependent dehydrogenase (short-subunit alcohol dehydrogenase family)